VLFRIQQCYNFNLPANLTEAHSSLVQALSEYGIVKMEHSQLRATYLEDLASACADKEQTSKASKLKELHNRENMREEFRRIKSAVGKKRGGKIASLKFSDEYGEQQKAFGKQAIEEVIKDANHNKFH